MEHRREAKELGANGEGLEATVAEHPAVGQELGQQRDGSELLGVGVVETELDENGACLPIDPRELMEESEILSDVRETTTELIHEARSSIGGMIADEGVGVEFTARSMDEGVANGGREREIGR